MPDRVIVTGGDAGYFDMIDELCASVRRFRSAEQLGLVVIDGGLHVEQAAHLATRWSARILAVGWDYGLKAGRIRGREHLKVLTSRTFLDELLPECELICWIDGDAWVQDIAAIDLLFQGAEKKSIAVVSQTSRYSPVAMTLDWGPLGFARVRSQLYKNARRAGLGEALARRVGDKPTLNAGVFALAREAPHWRAWRLRLAQCLRKGRIFTSDQLALGLIVHADGLAAELMPEICNYMGPAWTANAAGDTLVERYLPNSTVGVVHMAGHDRMRRDASVTVPITTTEGRVFERSLRRSAWVVDD